MNKYNYKKYNKYKKKYLELKYGGKVDVESPITEFVGSEMTFTFDKKWVD